MYLIMAWRHAIFFYFFIFYEELHGFYAGSMNLFRTLVWTNEITVFLTTRI